MAISENHRQESLSRSYLAAENFNDLCEASSPSKLLGLFLLDTDVNSSITYTQEELVLKKCMYWKSFLGQEKTTNSSRIRIKVPESNLISPSSICSLFQLLKEGKI